MMSAATLLSLCATSIREACKPSSRHGSTFTLSTPTGTVWLPHMATRFVPTARRRSGNLRFRRLVRWGITNPGSTSHRTHPSTRLSAHPRERLRKSWIIPTTTHHPVRFSQPLRGMADLRWVTHGTSCSTRSSLAPPTSSSHSRPTLSHRFFTSVTHFSESQRLLRT